MQFRKNLLSVVFLGWLLISNEHVAWFYHLRESRTFSLVLLWIDWLEQSVTTVIWDEAVTYGTYIAACKFHALPEFNVKLIANDLYLGRCGISKCTVIKLSPHSRQIYAVWYFRINITSDVEPVLYKTRALIILLIKDWNLRTFLFRCCFPLWEDKNSKWIISIRIKLHIILSFISTYQT